jgi:hypothetical protein
VSEEYGVAECPGLLTIPIAHIKPAVILNCIGNNNKIPERSFILQKEIIK